MSDRQPSPSRIWWPVVAWAIVQVTATSLPEPLLPPTPPGAGDIAHFGMYGMQAFLLWRAFTMAGRTARVRPGWLVLGLAAFGALDEAHQLFIPGRDASALDWVFDTVGATAGMWIGVTLMKTRLAAWLT